MKLIIIVVNLISFCLNFVFIFHL